MLRRLFFSLRRLDLWLFGATVLLVLSGLLMLYSITYDSPSPLLLRQSIFFAVGLLLLFGLGTFDYRFFRKVSVLFYILAVLLLAAVLFIGLNIKGSVRWFDLGLFPLQPVEVMKLALIIFLAGFFKKRLTQVKEFKTVLVSGLFAGVPIALTLMQPDLGSAMVLFFIWLGLLLVAGAKKKHLVWLALIFVFIATVAWFFFLHDYQKSRLTTFLDPASDPKGRGYNAIQAVIAVGSGGVFGRGLARGVVSQLRFLPERQTDFIFASLAEELGLVGVGLLLFLFGVWLFRIVRVIGASRENFGAFVASGIFFCFFSQSLINIGMNIGLLPITGIPLPLVSYGGSSLIMALVSVGVLQSIVTYAQPVGFD